MRLDKRLDDIIEWLRIDDEEYVATHDYLMEALNQHERKQQ